VLVLHEKYLQGDINAPLLDSFPAKKKEQNTFKLQLISNEIILKSDFSGYCSGGNPFWKLIRKKHKKKTQIMLHFGHPPLIR
jgi:hypothetical protein